jgi:hypothetical protein
MPTPFVPITFNATALRDSLIQTILSHQEAQLLPKVNSHPLVSFPPDKPDGMPPCIYTIESYCYLWHLANNIALLFWKNETFTSLASVHLGKPIPEIVDIEDDSCPLLRVLLTKDLDTVNLNWALVAWLTIDGFRWESLYPHLEFPDLNYGLVLQYPNYILTLAVVVTNLADHREGLTALLNKPTLDWIAQMAKEDTQRHLTPRLQSRTI